MKERPILFSAPMVRAILAGKKTQTRRLVRPQPDVPSDTTWSLRDGLWYPCVDTLFRGVLDPIDPGIRCPYGVDQLWVKETWQAWNQVSHERDEWEALTRDYRGGLSWAEWVELDGIPDVIEYRATSESVGPWTPSIHMPRWASRITLEVTSIRVERLQSITLDDARAEGLSCITKDGVTHKFGIPDRDGLPGTDDDGWPWHDWSTDPRAALRKLWDAINGGRADWASNPWVWVIGFRRLP